MAFRIVRWLSQVTVIFKEDQLRVQAPFVSELSDRLAKQYDVAQIGVEPSANNRFFWRAQRGSWKRGDQLQQFEEFHGNELELGARVEGSSSDASDFVDDVWATLGTLAGETPRSIQDSIRGTDYVTTTVVSSDRPYGDLVPAIREAEVMTRERLGDRLLANTPSSFTFHVPVRTVVGGIVLERKLMIENRYTADSKDGVFFLQSPLPSADHEAVVQRFFGR